MAAVHLFFCRSIFGLGLLLAAGSTFQQIGQQPDMAQQEHVQVPAATKELEGAWQLSSTTGSDMGIAAGNTVIRLQADGFFTVAYYSKEQKKFIGTYGGTYTLVNGTLHETLEFHTLDSTKVGQETSSTFTLRNGNWQLHPAGSGKNATQTWQRLQTNTTPSPLAGTWRITGREGRDGQMNEIADGPRKTIKILSDNRFQWIAYNSETAAFSGTGGGTYTLQNGKYTETIEFFSRDSSRVGKQLTFNYQIKNNKWNHSGLSSTGNRVNEVWQRVGTL